METAMHSCKKNQGFALIEVLVALLVLAFGLLGIAGLLLVVVKAETSSTMKQQAVQIAYDAVDRLRANGKAAKAGNYDVGNLVASGTPSYPGEPELNCETASCSPQQLAAFDTWYWLNHEVKQLPMGSGSIATTASGSDRLVTVTIQWDDAPAQRKLGAASPTAAGAANVAKFSIATSL
jgi:type IV pilus assembly protein PilV